MQTFVKIIMYGSFIVNIEAISFGTLATSLLSHGLQPQSTLSAGHGGYLRDDFRRQHLIPTFKRIKSSFLEMDHSVQILWVLFILNLMVQMIGFLFLGLYLYALRSKLQCLEASRT